MREIYSKAACCIAATAAEDGHKGLFFDRERWAWTPIKVEATWTHEQAQPRFPPQGLYWCGSKALAAVSAIDTAPLNQRAWVAQERYLCTRVLHFSWDLLFWECHDVLSNEAHPKGIPNLGYTGGENYDVRGLKRLVNTHRIIQITEQSPAKQIDDGPESSQSLDKVPSSDIYRSWHTFRSAYSQYGLTKDKDVFVALHGIAQDVAEAMGDEMICGLWKGLFLEELCWYCNSFTFFRNPQFIWKPTTWRAPSWSWGSTKLPTESSRINRGGSKYTESLPMITILEFLINAKPSGELERASFSMRCRLIPLALPHNDLTWNSYSVSFATGLGEEREMHEIVVRFDDPTTKASYINSRALYLVIIRQFLNGAYVEAEIEGIAVTPCDDQSDCFRRLGFFSNSYSSEQKYDEPEVLMLLEVYKHLEDTVIELV